MSPFFAILAAGAAMLHQEWTSGPVSVEVFSGTGPFTLAEVIEVRMIVTVPAASLSDTLRTGEKAAYRLDFAPGAWQRIPGLRFLSSPAPFAERGAGGSLRTVHRFRFEPRRTGDFEVPPLDLSFVSPEAPPIALRTGPIRFAVRGLVPGDPLKTAPRAMHELPGREADWRAGGALLVLLGIGSVWWMWRERVEAPDLPVEPPDPGEKALRELAASREPGHWRAILEGYVGAGPGFTAHQEEELERLRRDLDQLRFGREGSVGRKALRGRLEIFIRDGKR